MILYLYVIRYTVDKSLLDTSLYHCLACAFKQIRDMFLEILSRSIKVIFSVVLK